ncbi:MAG: TRAP transporter substrate-binding protein [Gammaproteobacteria bacterium]|nr:TRAP transporter substrate-binding protein [Gammaproteobacteria bacterium]MBU1653790.1 TRAP transporter substrate-binding protein [Gammaproteobacteria bacterium]MBU1961702.1 TRAP transporter substrate-binding protein [Gammaproteobacteria bacterium]
MQRRDFIKTLGAGSLALAGGRALADEAQYKWKMVTTWPMNFPGLGTTANMLAELIGEMSGGRIHVKVYGANELVPAFEIFDTVSRGGAEMGHGSAYYWKGKSEAAQFFSTVPFGLTAQEMNAWIYHGGGLALWNELYAQFGLVAAPAGNTGVQMGGWFNKEINSLEDLKGLKMRIPGLGGEVLQRLGGTPVNMPGGELFTSLQSGAIDATEWVGPYNDLAFGLFKAAKYYYYPGFHEPGTILEAMINKQALESLPKDLQSIVLNACKVANQDLLAEYTARNPAALETLLTRHKVDMRVYPNDVLQALRKISLEVVEELANKDKFTRKVYASYSRFYQEALRWSDISERAYLNARAGA